MLLCTCIHRCVDITLQGVGFHLREFNGEYLLRPEYGERERDNANKRDTHTAQCCNFENSAFCPDDGINIISDGIVFGPAAKAGGELISIVRGGGSLRYRVRVSQSVAFGGEKRGVNWRMGGSLGFPIQKQLCGPDRSDT